MSIDSFWETKVMAAGLFLVISLSGPTGPAPPNFSVPDTGTAGPVKSILRYFPIVLAFFTGLPNNTSVFSLLFECSKRGK